MIQPPVHWKMPTFCHPSVAHFFSLHGGTMKRHATFEFANGFASPFVIPACDYGRKRTNSIPSTNFKNTGKRSWNTINFTGVNGIPITKEGTVHGSIQIDVCHGSLMGQTKVIFVCHIITSEAMPYRTHTEFKPI